MNKIYFIFIGLLLSVGAAHAYTIGTVFYSNAERATLVAARSGITQTAIYSVTGIIKRGAGKSVVWVNGRAVTETPQDPTIPTLVIGRDHVMVEGKQIKVGESLDIISGQRVLRLPEQAVRVKP